MTQSQKNQLLCIWSGPVFVVLFAIGFFFCAGFLPPHSPSAGADEVAAIFRDNASMIRLGQVIMLLGSSMALAFVGVLSTQLRRIETGLPVFTFVQLAAGISVVVLLVVPCLLWIVAAFRPERAPELTQLLNDAAWLMLLTPFAPAGVQLLAVGFAVLGDRVAVPVFPRWVGFFNIWVAVLFLPGGLIPFFKSGPFAWNGLFGFWVPAIAFFGWFLTMTMVMRRSIKRQSVT